ncbi:MAG TPA: hypothetical protein GXX36_11600 [Clostridiaceae bacterium]|nr:hypothetical protein [Clostridiaceae bacterium]
MNKEKMEQLREVINRMISLDDCDQSKLLKKSQEMDKLILQAIKESDYIRDFLGDKLKSELDAIIDKIQPIQKIYDSMRIVDPIRKTVVEIREGTVCKEKSECYMLWKSQKICENCIAIRACNENDTIIKIEYDSEKVYMMTAIPISIQDRKFVLELFKDVTNSLYVDKFLA